MNGVRGYHSLEEVQARCEASLVSRLLRVHFDF